ncbi:DUF4437 domain-containing protein [Luteimonas gilva]|uniref:DUF4437 domain-containing protein n=1 Tax=Luteimonas gilva TaxID=2572684 RepID=A0A4U5JU89_9GAMM|nr:cupin domain-containing protein [Luteimonas gilva]TKR33402.1 DUF4437 domain-containing protein [Luteimonas gilva]
MKIALLIVPFAFAAGSAHSQVSKEPMIVAPLEAAKFVPSNPAAPNGTQVAVLRGDPEKGPSTMLMRMKLNKGRNVMHVHSSDYQLVVISGRMKHWSKAQSEEKAEAMGPGGYWFQPGGRAHTDACLSDECLMYIVWSGKRDGWIATDKDG